MKFVFTIYSVFSLLTALISFFVVSLAWQRRLVKGAKELVLLMFAAGLGATFLIFETASSTITEKIFWSKLEYIGGVFTPVLYLIFVMRFTGKDKFISLRNISLMLVVPVITLIMALTNETHNLIWSGFSAICEKTNLVEYYHGIGFWIGYIGYAYLSLLSATIYLIAFIIRQNRSFRSQGWIVLVGGVFPWIASIVYLSGSNPFPGMDLVPISITISGVLAAYAILNARVLDLMPVAREILIETLEDGIIALDGQNRIQDINGAALSFLGIANRKVIGLYVLDSYVGDERLLNAVVSPESVDQIEITTSNESRIFKIIKQPIKDPAGSRLIIIRDITDQITWQREIESGEERYRNMYNMFRLMADNSDDFLWAKGVDKNYIFCNRTLCERLLIAKDVNEPIGKTNEYFAARQRKLHPEDPEWFTFGDISDTDELTIGEGKPTQFDIFGNVKGEFLFLDVHKSPIRDEQGNLLGVVGMARDVTLTKKLERENYIALESLRKSEDELRKTNTEKDKFFSIIAHDLRNPFTGFVGLTRIMDEELSNLSMEELKDLASTMKNSAANLFRLLENLLQWSRIQQGLIPFNPEKIELFGVVDEEIKMIEEVADNKKIEIFNEIVPGMLVFSDSNILQTVIRNLLSNAVKFTPKGGQVNLSAKPVENQRIEFSITDTGIGMNENMVENLFRVDIQTNREGTEGEPSTGLGLLLCKEFIEKNGGNIRVESKVGKGSTFIFTIPDHPSVN